MPFLLPALGALVSDSLVLYLERHPPHVNEFGGDEDKREWQKERRERCRITRTIYKRRNLVCFAFVQVPSLLFSRFKSFSLSGISHLVFAPLSSHSIGVTMLSATLSFVHGYSLVLFLCVPAVLRCYNSGRWNSCILSTAQTSRKCGIHRSLL